MAETVFITGVSSGSGGTGWPKVFLERGGRAVLWLQPPGAGGLGPAGAWPSKRSTWPTRLRARPPSERLIADAKGFDLVVLNAGKLGKIRDIAGDRRWRISARPWRSTSSPNKWLLDLLFRQAGGDPAGRRESSSGDLAVRQPRLEQGGGLQGLFQGPALNMLVKLYAGEYPEAHFTALAPGLVDTAMQDYLTSLPEDGRYKPFGKAEKRPRAPPRHARRKRAARASWWRGLPPTAGAGKR